MAFQTINIGTIPNDGNGDDDRDAWDKVNDNFLEAANTTENTSFSKFVGFGTRTSATITSGSVTITSSNVGITGEGGAADNLDTLNGGSEGDIVFLSRGASSGTITVTESGNIELGSTTRALSSAADQLMLKRGTTNWNEISYSDNS
jgi:hypothetical protein